MAKAKVAGTHTGAFKIEYRPDVSRQQVGIIFEDYKNEGQDKAFMLFKPQFNSLVDCDPANGFAIRRPLDAPCKSGCKVLGKGKYSVGGVTDSNPVVLTFDDGKSMILTLEKIKAIPKTCSKGLDDLKI